MRIASQWLLILLVIASVHLAEAQQPKKVTRIGFLHSESSSSAAARMESFRQALRERGYLEGANIAIEYRYAEGKLDRLPLLAAELVQMKVDLIVGTGIPTIRAAQQATKTIPIVMTNVPDPIAYGFVASLAKPGGNITGLTQVAEELSGKRLELLKESFPKVSRVGVFVNTVMPVDQRLASLQRAAKNLGIKPQTGF
jgi:putative ABC transport system substrate-binding protein